MSIPTLFYAYFCNFEEAQVSDKSDFCNAIHREVPANSFFTYKKLGTLILELETQTGV